MRHTSLVLSALAVISVCGSASAAIIDISGGQVTMNQLVGNSFIVGDKQFFIDGYNGTSIAPAAVTVQAVNLGLAGIGFDLIGQWADAPGDANGTGFDLSYHVSVLQPGFFITDSHLHFNGFAAGQGSFANVAESVFSNTGGLLGTKLVFANGGLPPSQWVLDDSLNFSPRTTVYLVKNFHLFANGPEGVANASSIRQTFSQIPTPGAASLFAVVGLAAVRRRR